MKKYTKKPSSRQQYERSFYMETPNEENYKFFFFFNSLYRFVRTNQLDVPTSKISKKLFAIG